MKSPSLCKYILCNLLWHLTPASSQCPYWHWNCWWDAWGQLMRVVSLPRQPTSSRWIGPTPAPKETLLKATVYARIKLYFDRVQKSCSNIKRSMYTSYWFYASTVDVQHKFNVLLPTLGGVSQLSTHHSSISVSPEVITHSTPLIVNADFHSAFTCNDTTNQSQLTRCAGSCKIAPRVQ